MESKLITVSGVTGYIDENGTAQLNLENVARGLGFTDNSRDVEYVKWDRVRQYLNEIGFSTDVSKDMFIPENIFYRLAFKASNKTAVDFQCKVADEILPAIRKTGAYMTDQVIERTLADPDYLIQIATRLKAEREARLIAEHKAAEMTPKAQFYDTVTGSKDCIDIGTAAKTLQFSKGRTTLFRILRENKILMANNIPYQEFCDRGYFRVIETSFTKPTGEAGTYSKTVVYQRGLDFIRRMLVKQGYMKETA